MDLVYPGVDTSESLLIIKVVNEHDSNGIFIVSPGDGPEGLLAGLHRVTITVSQI